MEILSKNKIYERNVLLLASGVLLTSFVFVVLINKKLNSRKMPNARRLKKSLSQIIGLQSAQKIILDIQSRYFILLENTPKRKNAALQKHIAANILVGLALYQSLKIILGDQSMALQITQDTLEDAYIAKLQAPVRMLGKLPRPFPIFRWTVRARMRQDFPAEGWKTEWLIDNEHEIAFNLHSCLYLDVLQSHGAEELTSVFCHLDDVMMEGVDYVSWERTQTQGYGAEYCDFRWVRTR